MSVPTGSIVGILGPNGSGKTTLLRVVTGRAKPTSGQLTVLGVAAEHLANIASHRLSAHLNPAEFDPALSGLQNLRFLAALGRVGGVNWISQMENFGIAQSLFNRPVRSYSTGQRQRLGLASALLAGREMVVLDEPEQGLDPLGVTLLRQRLKEARIAGTTVVFSSHVASGLEDLCDEVVLLADGRAAFQGSPAALISAHPRGPSRVRLAQDSDTARASELLKARQMRVGIEVSGVLVVSECARSDDIGLILYANGIPVVELTHTEVSFEQAVWAFMAREATNGC